MTTVQTVEILVDGETVPIPAVAYEGRYYLDDDRILDPWQASVVITPKQAAAQLHATYAQVCGWLRSGKLRGVQVAGFFWYVYASALVNFVPPKRGRPKSTRGKE